MLEINLVLFVVTSLMIIVSPGQDLVLVMTRGISQGSQAGVFTAGGVSTGLLGHTFFAALGLGALLMASEFLFNAIKFVGAAYLIYLGYKLLTTKGMPEVGGYKDHVSLKSCFVTGALSNISNPKVTLFYFAYLPQFVPGGQESTWVLLMLGSIFALLTFIVKGPIGYFAGRFSGWALRNHSGLTWFNRFSGMVLIALGLKLATQQR